MRFVGDHYLGLGVSELERLGDPAAALVGTEDHIDMFGALFRLNPLGNHVGVGRDQALDGGGADVALVQGWVVGTDLLVFLLGVIAGGLVGAHREHPQRLFGML